MILRSALPLFLLLLTASTAAAQLVPGWNTKQFTLERIDADRVRLMRDVEVEGEKGSPNEGQKFFADDLEMNLRTGELVGTGNVVFSTPDARISADGVVFNTKTKLGSFSNATGIASLGERGNEDRSMFGTMEPDVYFYGQTIEKVGPDKYKISKGGFTTCVQPAPRWEIVSGNATVNLNDYAILRNAVIRVKNVPVFYLPVIYYPIQEDDRATGLLIPTYGRSTYRGTSISNAFFWAINRSQDATLLHDWFTSRGQGYGGEYRYMAGPSSQGNLRAYRLNEKASTVNGAAQPERQSYEINGSLTQRLPANLQARASVQYFSSLATQQIYNNNFFDATQSTRAFGGGVSGSWRALSVSGNFQRSEYFTSGTDSTVTGTAPGIMASYSGRRIGNLPLYASVNADASRLLYVQNNATASNDLGFSRFDFLPSLRAPLSKLPFLSVNATLGYRVTRFGESLDPVTGRQNQGPIVRRYADMKTEVVGPVFTRVFNPNNAIADRLKHVFEPNVGIQRITAIDVQNQVPTTTGAFEYIVGGTTRVNYGLTNRLLVRKAARTADDTPAASADAPRELLSVGITQSYYSNNEASKYDSSYTYGYLFRDPSTYSPIALVARAQPTTPVGVDFRLEYDPVKAKPTPGNPTPAAKKKLVGFGLNGTIRAKVIETTAGWSKRSFGGETVQSSNNYIQQATTLHLADNKIGATVQFNYDIGRSTLLQQRYIANYNAQCCGIAMEYQTFNYPTNIGIGIPQDRRFNLSFTLAGVGAFSNFFGAFGGSTY